VRTLLRASRGISSGILGVAEARGSVGLILMGWRGQLSTRSVSGGVVKDVVHGAPCDVAVLRDRGVMEESLDHVPVPTGGGPHARLALRLAWDVIKANSVRTALRSFSMRVHSAIIEVRSQARGGLECRRVPVALGR
jgi:hypothetical protein